MNTKKNKPIYLHVAFNTTSKDRSMNLTGDSYVCLTGDSGLKALKDGILKNIQEEFPDKDWNEVTLLAITELRGELYYRLFPERRPKPQEPTE